ncbi:VOC family protein [Aquihabitans sp. G128]|uniref:VOC family protein n=1 Tax=Aquihabitans sp. G128 TaxID=2849779 RepID=UPI0020B35A66|nr:VOC family protein [Aquihabitans sp. G128]
MELQLDVVEIVVADMAASLAFYRQLGLDLPPEADGEPHVEVVLPGGVKLAWDTVETIRSFSDFEAPTGSARMSLAFGCSSPAEVDEVHAALVAGGARSHLEPFDAFWGQRYATLHDPDGNGIDLFAALD